MASVVTAAFKQAIASRITETTKINNLQQDFIAPSGSSRMTTDAGVKISDTDNWLRASGKNIGPALLEDQVGREKIMRFDHERIPERVVHARGSGAHGQFRVFDDRASKWTFAPVLTDPSRTTPIFIRFSTVMGFRGSADTVRDVRGFAMKFYTEEGNWDLVGNDIPVFFIQDGIKFPDLIHSGKPEPHNEVPQAQSAHNNFWDFFGLQPESAHMVLWTMSDRGIPRSFRMVQGFGVNTYTLNNADGKRFFVKFHMTPELGVCSLVWDEALKISGQDPDFHRKDLEEAINAGIYPKWTLAVQVIEEKDEHNFDFDILDATKLWPSDLVPIQPIGEFELNRTVDEFFTETEQVGFCTSHIVPGIGFSDDPLLQARNFSYFDTQISRLGVNWQELPINRPICPVMNNHRDGAMRHTIAKSNLNYWPNRESVNQPSSQAEGGLVEYKQKVEGIKARIRTPKFQEHYNQAQLFFNSLTDFEKNHMIASICFELSHCDDPRVYENYTQLLNNIDYDLAKTVAINVNGVVPDKPARKNHGKKDKTLSQTFFLPKTPTIASRRIAILIADGFNTLEVEAVRAMLATDKAMVFVIGPRRGKIYAAGDQFGSVKGIVAHHHFEGQRSILFDAVYIPSGDHAKSLRTNGRVIHWIREAFGHCKAIAAVGEAVSVVEHALSPISNFKLAQTKDQAATADVVASYGVVTAGKYDAVSALKETALAIKPDTPSLVSRFAYEISQHRCFARETAGLTSQVAY